jgi:hypothetical protein
MLKGLVVETYQHGGNIAKSMITQTTQKRQGESEAGVQLMYSQRYQRRDSGVLDSDRRGYTAAD